HSPILLNSARARFAQRAKRSRLLESPACAQNKRVRTDRTDDLQADGKSLARQAAGNGSGWLLRQVEWIRERRPIRPRLARLTRWRDHMTHVESGQWHGRRQQQVIAFEEPGTCNMQLRALELPADIVRGGCLESLRRGSDKGRLGLVANPLTIGLQKRRERRPPQRIPDRDWVPVNLRIAFINVGAELSENTPRRIHRRLDFRVDALGVSQPR